LEKSKEMAVYVDPKEKTALTEQDDFLLSKNGSNYPILKYGCYSVPAFVEEEMASKTNALASSYSHDLSVEHYSNFKAWLFETFKVDEHDFRINLMKKMIVRDAKRILITGCGLGDDIAPVFKVMGKNIEIHATDFSSQMVKHAAGIHEGYSKNLRFSICDACFLPFEDNYFDAVFHFGGINFFSDIPLAIKEMVRVVRPQGKVGFGDESVGPWLRDLDYGKMVINNNSLWAALPPIEKLPVEAVNVNLEWILGNCFYFISFSKNPGGAYINADVPHKGPRGGTMRTRYYGTLEGVPISLKEQVLEQAKSREISVSDFVKEALGCYIKK